MDILYRGVATLGSNRHVPKKVYHHFYGAQRRIPPPLPVFLGPSTTSLSWTQQGTLTADSPPRLFCDFRSSYALYLNQTLIPLQTRFKKNNLLFKCKINLDILHKYIMNDFRLFDNIIEIPTVAIVSVIVN